jgi:hypothetical protein
MANVGVTNRYVSTQTNATLSILEGGAGIYRAIIDVSFSGSPNVEYEGALFDGTNELDQVVFHRKIGSGGDVGAAAASGIVTATTNSVYTVQFQSESANKTITIRSFSLDIVRISDM